ALCVPPGPDGAVPQATLAAAALLALDEVYRVGGAQAIAAMAYGTETIRPVDVIVGPGNVYVTLAKREVAGVVGIEATADPSSLVPLVRHAGAVFCGHFAPAAVGDYVAGVNHVLPTARTARFSSALRVANFCKHLHVVGLDESALGRVAPYVAAFADTE